VAKKKSLIYVAFAIIAPFLNSCVSTPEASPKIAQIDPSNIKSMDLVEYIQPADCTFSFSPSNESTDQNGFVSSDSIGLYAKFERKARIAYAVRIQDNFGQWKDTTITDIGNYPVLNSNYKLTQNGVGYDVKIETKLELNGRRWITSLDIPIDSVEKIMSDKNDMELSNGDVKCSIKFNDISPLLTEVIKSALSSPLNNLAALASSAMGLSQTNDQIEAEARRTINLASIIDDHATMARMYETLNDYDNAISNYKIANLNKDANRVEEIQRIVKAGGTYYGKDSFFDTFNKLTNAGMLEKNAYYYLAGVQIAQYLDEKTAICVCVNLNDDRSQPFIIKLGNFNGKVLEYNKDMFGLVKGADVICCYNGFILGNPTFTVFLGL